MDVQDGVETLDLTPGAFGRGVPFEEFAELRRRAPVHWYEAGQYWVVSSYALVRKFNRDFVTFSSTGGVGDPADPMYEEPKVLLSMDPPIHSKYRRPVNKPFTTGPIAGLENKIRRIAREALASFLDCDTGDFVTQVAAPVPFRVIADLVGLPREDEQRVFQLTNASMPNSDPEYRSSRESATEAVRALRQYSSELLAERRRRPSDDLASALAQMSIDGEPVAERELCSIMEGYIAGGSETTRHLISHGLQALLESPDQLELVRSGEVSVASAVEEMLRWATPVMQHSRWPTRCVEVAGRSIEPGQRVTLWMISANRDEEVFSDPNTFAVGRQPNPHASFGSGGPHYCLGVHLARLEAVVLFEELLPHIHRMHLDGPVERLQSDFLNGIKHIPVRLS